jgi:hypothetical protein
MADGDNFVLGKNNNADAETALFRLGAASNAALHVRNNTGHGILGIGIPGSPGYGVGVLGLASDYIGVNGQSQTSIGVRGDTTSGLGVYGLSQTGTGVRGDTTSNVGVYGLSQTGTGVRGDTTSGGSGVYGKAEIGIGVRGDSADSTGVLGQSNTGVGVHGHGADLAGVFGTSQGRVAIRGRDEFATPGLSTAVVGQSLNGAGVGGKSRTGNGVIGEWAPDDPASTAGGGCGVLGRAHPPDGRGVLGFSNEGFAISATTSTGFAGVFEGDVFVTGNFTVKGGRKSAAMPLADGSTRLLHCMEGPQPWFEDVGRAGLVEGRAAVDLDPDFAAVIERDDYNVFLTPEADCNGLFVSDRGPDGFEVRELAGGTGTLQFSYRLVARRRDVPGDRLPEIELPPPVDPRGVLDVEIPEPPAVDLPSELPAVPSVVPDEISDPPAVPFDDAKSAGPEAGR